MKDVKSRNIYVLFFAIHLAVAQNLHGQDKTKWVDPGDMFNHKAKDADKSIKTDLISYKIPNNEVQENTSNLKEAIRLLTDSGLVPESPKLFPSWEFLFKMIKNHKNCPEVIFVQRFIAKLLLEFKKVDSDFLVLNVHLNKEERNILENVLYKKRSFSSVDDIIFKLFEDVSIPTPVNFTSRFQSIFNFFNDVAPDVTVSVVLLLSACVVYWTFNSRDYWVAKIAKLAFIGLIFSLSWRYIYLYKKAISERKKIISQSSNIAEECLRYESSWWWSWFSSSSPYKCEKYFDAIVIDPIWDISILDALVNTFSKPILDTFMLGTRMVVDNLTYTFSELGFIKGIIVVNLGAYVLILMIATCFLPMLCLSGLSISWLGLKITRARSLEAKNSRSRIEELEPSDADKQLPVTQSKTKSVCSNCDRGLTARSSCNEDQAEHKNVKRTDTKLVEGSKIEEIPTCEDIKHKA